MDHCYWLLRSCAMSRIGYFEVIPSPPVVLSIDMTGPVVVIAALFVTYFTVKIYWWKR